MRMCTGLSLSRMLGCSVFPWDRGRCSSKLSTPYTIAVREGYSSPVGLLALRPLGRAPLPVQISWATVWASSVNREDWSELRSRQETLPLRW
jgi:hypothetical protein